MTTDTKLDTTDRPRGVRMQLGVNGTRRSATVEPGNTVRSAPKRMQLGINGARRAPFETRRAAPAEAAVDAPLAAIELGTCP